MNTATNTAGVVPTKTSRDWLKIASLVLAIIGTFIAGYLSYTKIFNTEIACANTSVVNCDAVQHSAYAQVGPIPVMYLGLVGYILILLTLVLETRLPFLQTRGRLIVFGLTLFGVLFSGYLTAIEAFVLHQWCEWCVGSAITMTVLFIVSFARLWRSMGVIPLDNEE